MISKFKEWDTVRVLKGVMDPDFNINIGGWSGDITEVYLSVNYSWLYTIVWDEETLLYAGENYEIKCKNKNLDFERIILEEKELGLLKNSILEENCDLNI